MGNTTWQGFRGDTFRRVFRKLTPEERIEVRREYRYIREALGLTPIQASGVVNRLVDACTWHIEED